WPTMNRRRKCPTSRPSARPSPSRPCRRTSRPSGPCWNDWYMAHWTPGPRTCSPRRAVRHTVLHFKGPCSMNDDQLPGPASAPPQPRAVYDTHPLGSSTIYRLCEEVISLRERNNRQHQEFDRKLNAVRDDLKSSFNSFAADTQRAYQQLRQETHGEKRVS